MNKYRIEIKWGIIFFISGLVWMYFEKLMGWHGPKIDQHPIYTNLYFIVAVAIFVFGLLEKRKSLGGKMTWKEGFIAGLIITLTVTVLSPLSQYIVATFISPEYFSNAIEYSVVSEKMTKEDAQAFFNFQNYLMMAAIGAVIMGAVTSAVVALFVRRK